MPAAIYSHLATDPIFRDIVAQFVSELPFRLTAIEQAVAHGDRDMIRRLAHQLKGSAGSYGFGVVTDVSERLEYAVLEDQELAMLETVIAELRELIGRVRSGIPG